MSTRVGEVELYVDLDGRRIPVQTKKLAEQVGQALDSEFKGLSRRMDGISTDISRIGKDLERAFQLDDIGNLRQVRDTFDEIDGGARRAAIGAGSFRREYDGINDGVLELRQVAGTFQLLGDEARRGGAGVRGLGGDLDDTSRRGDAFRRVLGNLADAAKTFAGPGGGLDNMSRKLADNRIKWSDLGHETRQWTLIIGAVMAGMQDIAVLGSAAGAGLVAVGGAGLSLVTGVGAAAAVFKTLSMELDELPPSMREAKKEFDVFKDSFGDLRTVIASGALKQMTSTFSELRSTVSRLEPSFYGLGITVGRLLDDLSRNIRPGTEAFGQLNRSVELASPNFDSLARSSGTLGLALIRSFNRAQPLVQDLTGYVDKLVGRFDAFTRSSGFDEWILRSQKVFGSLGQLLDATGRALNDLVTPAAVNRTTKFLDNLTGFMPSLTVLLDNLGRLDLFGLAAQLLNDFGAALVPLEVPLGNLAEALSGKLSAGISAAAAALNVFATVAAPIVDLLADLVDAVPDGFMTGLVASLAVASSALLIFRGATALGGAITSMSTFTATAATTLGASKSLATGLATGIGRAGLIGGIAGGFVLAASAAGSFEKAILRIDDKARNVIASGTGIKSAYEQLGPTLGNASKGLTNVSDALDALSSVGTQRFSNIFAFFGTSMSEAGGQAIQLSRTLEALDPQLSSLANQNLPAAQGQFQQWAKDLGATDAQVLNLINQMPSFKQALIDSAAASGKAASDSDLVAMALGRTSVGADTAVGALARFGAGIAGSSQNTLAQEASLALLEGRTLTAGGAVDGLADKIRGFGSATLDTREANRQFEEAIDAVTESVGANGTSLDIATAAGRANEASLDSLAQKSLNAAAAALEQTGSQDQATAAINRGREELRRVLDQFGITGQAAEDYINKLGLVPGNVDTAVKLNDADTAEGRLNDLARTRTAIIRVQQDGSVNVGNGMTARPYATGGTLYGPELIYAGEAGPEAIVPLDRPLHDVDPSVRLLSALAQGKFQLPQAASGSSGPVFHEGAIVVRGALDPRRTAIEVANEIAEASVS